MIRKLEKILHTFVIIINYIKGATEFHIGFQ